MLDSIRKDECDERRETNIASVQRRQKHGNNTASGTNKEPSQYSRGYFQSPEGLLR
jgi:hypothetical protein